MRSTRPVATQTWRWDNYLDHTLSRYLFAHEYRFISQTLGGLRSARILEVGCGSGRIARPLASAGFSLLGMDPDLTALRIFQQRTGDVPLIQGDAISLPFSDHSYDCVLTIEAFQYFRSHQTFLSECNRVLRPGGTLIFQSLNRKNYKRAIKRLIGRSAQSGLPSGDLSAQDLLAAVVAHGFAPTATHGYYWMPFARFSNNPLVGLAAFIEWALQLHRHLDGSPWVLIAAQKVAELSQAEPSLTRQLG